jgi:phenylacetyl-CoA:acceptor oxidoreductase subunit 1
MDYDTCIGCASCAVACPYQARTIVHEKTGYYGGEKTLQEEKVAHDDRIGVANKCTFCVERIDEAVTLGLTPGVDPEVTPACSVSCIAKAIR